MKLTNVITCLDSSCDLDEAKALFRRDPTKYFSFNFPDPGCRSRYSTADYECCFEYSNFQELKGLNKGQKAGVAIGVIIAVGALGIAGFYLWKKKKQIAEGEKRKENALRVLLKERRAKTIYQATKTRPLQPDLDDKTTRLEPGGVSQPPETGLPLSSTEETKEERQSNEGVSDLDDNETLESCRTSEPLKENLSPVVNGDLPSTQIPYPYPIMRHFESKKRGGTF